MLLTAEDQLQLAKDIAAWKRGEADRPSVERLRAAVDTIRKHRQDFVATTKSRTKADKVETAPAPKAVVQQMDWADLGF